MKSHFLKPFDDGKYLSEEESLKLLESIPIPKDDPEKVEDQKPLLPETPAPPVSVTSIDDFIVLKDIRCVDADGNVFEQYDELQIAKDVFRQANGKQHRFFTPYEAIVHFEQQGLFLPSFALSCNIIANLFQAAVEKKSIGYTVKYVVLKQILDQYNDHGVGHGWQAQNTVVNWDERKIIHYPHNSDFPKRNLNNNINQNRPLVKLPIPIGIHDMSLADALQNAEVTKYVRNLTGLEDPSVLVQVGKYFEKTTYIWTSSALGTRAAWLGCNDHKFNFDAYNGLGKNDAARGVGINPTPKNGGAP